MSVNPLMLPILYELHDATRFAEIGELLLAGHLMGSYATGFGKLADEKLLPLIFGTTKLTKAYRNATPPLSADYFDNIDHVVPRPGQRPTLLTLKASRWTINLSAALNLNSSFDGIVRSYPGQYSGIVVGVLFGRTDQLSDKYDLLRGINRGAPHNVVDVRGHVQVLAGRSFWSWINGDEPKTQDWILNGIVGTLAANNYRVEYKRLLTAYTQAFSRTYQRFVRPDGTVDWAALLTHING